MLHTDILSGCKTWTAKADVKETHCDTGSFKKTTTELEGENFLIKHFQIFDGLICEFMVAGANLEAADKIIHLYNSAK